MQAMDLRGRWFALCIGVASVIAIALSIQRLNKRTDVPSTVAGLPFGGEFPLASPSVRTFEEVVGLPPLFEPTKERDYGVYALLTTRHIAEYKCAPCRAVNRAVEQVAARVDANERRRRKVHFIELDVKNFQVTFAKMNIQQLPMFMYLPPTKDFGANRKSYIEQVRVYDLRHHAGLEVGLPAFLRGTANVEVAPVDPVLGTMKKVLMVASLALIASLVMFAARTTAADLFSSDKLWTFMAISFMIAAMSGLMWCRIRQVPYLAAGRMGEKIFVAPNTQAQLGIESHLIMALNGVCAVAMLALATKIPDIKNRTARRSLTTFALLALMLAFSGEISMMRRKTALYPLRLLLP